MVMLLLWLERPVLAYAGATMSTTLFRSPGQTRHHLAMDSPW